MLRHFQNTSDNFFHHKNFPSYLKITVPLTLALRCVRNRPSVTVYFIFVHSMLNSGKMKHDDASERSLNFLEPTLSFFLIYILCQLLRISISSIFTILYKLRWSLVSARKRFYVENAKTSLNHGMSHLYVKCYNWQLT